LNPPISDALDRLLLSPPGGRAAPDTLPALARTTAPASLSLPPLLVLATDAWHPQVNGVVHTWSYMRRELASLGVATEVIAAQSPSVPVPGEPGLRLALRPGAIVRAAMARLQSSHGNAPFALHIATEGPLGWAARRWALSRALRFTTSYHTRFPEYFERRFRLPAAWSYPTLRRFHARSEAVLAPTPRMVGALQARGFARVRLWPRGVDATAFVPHDRDALDRAAGRTLPRPIFLSVGRVAPEKNLEALLALQLPGSVVVVGDGPALPRLRARHPHAVWLGARPHAALPPLYAAADVFVFPSRTDTFGLVMLEAMACGTPVAAFPVIGPLDVVEPGRTGVLDDDLARACLAALTLPRDAVRAAAQVLTWRRCAEILGHALQPQAWPAPSSTGH
jgi:glycosyltransferase involved in cell wall biosynthesis